MKKYLKFLCTLLTASLIFTLGSCDNEFEYTMKSYTTGVLSYSVPDHLEPSYHEEAHAYYASLNANVLVYSYTHRQLRAAFPDYDGSYTAYDFASFLVEFHGYNCSVNLGSAENSAVYSFLFSDEYGSYYSTCIVLNDSENVCLLMFSCPSEKLELYQDMIVEILTSPRINK